MCILKTHLYYKAHKRNNFKVHVSTHFNVTRLLQTILFSFMGQRTYWQTQHTQWMWGFISAEIKSLWAEVLQTNCSVMNLSWNNKQHLNAALSSWLMTVNNVPLHPSYIFIAPLGNSLWICTVCVCSRVSLGLFVHTSTHCCTHGLGAGSMSVCARVRRGVVRQLTSCANDHLTAESHNVLQHHTVLYCLCCHGDILFSTIKCWYWLIVLASSGLFFRCTHTNTQMLMYSLFPLTHTCRNIVLWLLYFLWVVSTGRPWDQSQAVDLPYHKMIVLWPAWSCWKSSIGAALLQILH